MYQIRRPLDSAAVDTGQLRHSLFAVETLGSLLITTAIEMRHLWPRAQRSCPIGRPFNRHFHVFCTGITGASGLTPASKGKLA